jgi:hypothetical protein
LGVLALQWEEFAMVTRRTVVGMLCSVLVLGFASTAALAAGDATGTWTWKVTRQNNEVTMTLKLKQDGEKVTGTLSGMGGQETEIKDGTVKDGTLAFAVTRKGRNNQETTTKYSGKIDGDTIKGKMEREGGNGQARDWEAKREK